MNDYVALILGLSFAAAGGEFFVRGAVGLAQWARISPGIIGATVAAFATSSPEQSVSIIAAASGKPQISLGDALGSNVVNIALILGITLLFSGIQSPRDSIKRDFRAAILAPVVTAFLFLDGRLSRFDGIVMLCMFFAWIAAVIIEAKKQRHKAEKTQETRGRWMAIGWSVLGLALLIAAGNFIVSGAKGIAHQFGIGEFIIGATIVAIGTSTPELATAVISKLRGHDEIGLGTLLGSNVFNGLFIVPVAALICPIIVAWRDVAVALLFGLLAIVFSYPPRGGFIHRSRGILLLALYVAYVAAIFLLKTS